MGTTGGSGSVRKLRAAVVEAVTAALAADPMAFELGCQLLAAADQPRLRLVQGQIVRELLEELHPSGLDTATAQDVLSSCVQAAAGWFPEVDAQLLVIALLGALNAAEPDGQPVTDDRAVALHGSLLIADLLATAAEPGAHRSAEPDADGLDQQPDQQPDRQLDRLLDRAFAEIQRAETIELP